jgi:hypothetical protein
LTLVACRKYVINKNTFADRRNPGRQGQKSSLTGQGHLLQKHANVWSVKEINVRLRATSWSVFCRPQREHRGRDEKMGSVSDLSAGAYTATFVCDSKYSERGWACTPHPHQPVQIFPS